MPIPQPNKVRAVEYGDYIHVSWESQVNPDIDGFKIYIGANPIPDWNSAIDNGLNDSNDGVAVKLYSALVHVPTMQIHRGETFETYPDGEVTIPMNFGLKWDGPWSINISAIGYIGHGDNFESYTDGEITESMDSGSGWDGPWGTTVSEIGYKGYGDNFESYSLGVQSNPLSEGNGFSGAWSTKENEIGYKGYGDNFESYAVGIQTEPLSGGSGFIGAWKE